jgi:diadenosine tetraphosphatase ApaH/serine/threonine PP2A family protein phosphatase
MALLALVSDIHSNIEALRTAMGMIDDMGIPGDNVLCLGDVIGYGPNPCECIDLAADWRWSILGNHEEAVLKTPIGFSAVARKAVLWTRDQVRNRVFGSPQRARRWAWLEAMGYKVEDGDVLYVHGSPRDPTMEYVMKRDLATMSPGGALPEKMAEIFAKMQRLCFVGHTHVPAVFGEDGSYITPDETEHEFEVPRDMKYLVNIGSVGQPRDGDPRGCFATFDDESQVIRWHRFDFDRDATAEKIRANPNLDDRSALRLVTGE